jgi:hypothetical protein
MIVAALLLSNLGGNAAAADKNEQRSKRAQKIIATLESAGINNSDLKNLIAEADTHVEGKYFYLSDNKTESGRLSLRYQFGGKPSVKRLQLNFTPEYNSNINMTLSTEGAMIRYRYEFK